MNTTFFKSLSSVTSILFLIQANSQICFNPPISYTGNGDAICSSDFNNDGIPDLAVSYNSGSEVNILIGQGAGVFAPGVSISGTIGCMQIISEDFNNDGKSDLATANYDNGKVSIILGNGNGTFNIQVDYIVAVGSNWTSLSSADFNEDSYMDIAIGWAGSFAFNVIYGVGDGTFTTYSTFDLGSPPNAITCADFNNDGHKDVATSNYNGYSISVALGDGTGGFLASNDFGTTLNCWSIKSGDFNSDGYTDIVTANPDVDNISVYFGDGTGLFGTAYDHAVGDSPFSITVNDFNNDGNKDIAVGNKYDNTLSFLIGDGPGTFTIEPAFTIGSPPSGICSADFDGNGSIDCATSNSSSGAVAIVLNSMPTILTTTTDSLCGDGVAALSATASSGSIFWYETLTGGTPIEAGGTFTTPFINTTTIYYVESSTIGCGTFPRTPVQVSVNPISDITQSVTIGSSDSLIVGSSVYFTSGSYVDTLFSSNGCDSLVRTELTVVSSFTNYAFSPNDDGINDSWFIDGLILDETNQVKIFDRWGQELINIDNYNNDDISWNGNLYNGKRLLEGTYYYTIAINGYQNRSGWVQIVK